MASFYELVEKEENLFFFVLNQYEVCAVLNSLYMYRVVCYLSTTSPVQSSTCIMKSIHFPFSQASQLNHGTVFQGCEFLNLS